MNNFCALKNTIGSYLVLNGVELDCLSNLHDTSINNSNKQKANYVYIGKKDLNVLDMDLIAKKAYKIIKHAEGKDNIINTADAFVINYTNDWFFIEFKDSEIKAENSGLKNNVLKKAYSNWYMMLDILYSMNEAGERFPQFNLDNPVRFAKEHVNYILVCSRAKNPTVYQQIKNHDLIGETYTPPFMQRLKDYMFKDAYVYTEEFLERKFVNGFEY